MDKKKAKQSKSGNHWKKNIMKFGFERYDRVRDRKF